MGIKQSKNIKRYRISDNLGRIRWNYEDNIPEDPNDPMNDPTYNLQGEPDTYINSLLDDTIGDVWVARDGSGNTCVAVDDDSYRYDSRQYLDRETVLHGTDQGENFPPDHYDLINDSHFEESETHIKRVVSAIPKRHDPRPYHKLPKRRLEYEQMVKIFQPLIVTNVIVRRLLPYLPFLSDPDKIRAIEERSPRAAVIYLIDELCSNNNQEPGRWKQFIQALENCGYKYIVETLRGQDPVDHTYQREYLKIITPVLRQLIEPSELIPILWAGDVISNEDSEEIRQTERNFGVTAASDKLLDMVPRRHRFWYAHLVDALKKVGREDAADILSIPEILNSEEQKEDLSNKSRKLNEEIVGKIDDNTDEKIYLDMDDTEELGKIDAMAVPDNCVYLDCDELYIDPEDGEIDQLYFEMHRSKGKSSNNENVPKTSTHGSQKVDRQVEEKNRRELEHIYTIQSNSQLEDEETYEESDTIKFEIDQASNDSALQRKQNQKFDIDEGDTSNPSDIYKYEPPLPALSAPETPGQKNDEDESSEISVEVIKLSSPKPRRKHLPEHTSSLYTKANITENPPMIKRLNKPPVPTPRKRTSYMKSKGPTEQIHLKANISSTLEKQFDDAETITDDEDIEEDKGEIAEEDGDERNTNIPENNFEDTLQTQVEGKISTACCDLKRFGRAKVKASILKQKKIDRKVHRSRQNSRLKTSCLSSRIFQTNHADVLSLMHENELSAIKRQRRVMPNRKRKCYLQVDHSLRSNSLPAKLETELQVGEAKNQTEENESKDDKTNTQLDYSEPFRSHRGKEDENIFTTAGQINFGGITKRRHAVDQSRSNNFPWIPSNLEKDFENRRRLSDTDELLDILEYCNNSGTDIGCNLKSNTEIKTITKESLNPKLRQNLEKVKDLEFKLNHLLHDGKVLERRLQLQEDVNEILKRNKEVSNKLMVKEKEANGLEAAVSEMLDPMGATHCPNYQNYAEESVQSACITVGNETSTDGEREIRHWQSTTMTELPFEARNRNKYNIDNTDNDSAFCSEFSTKL